AAPAAAPCPTPDPSTTLDIDGQGVLVPALVIGLGGVGLQVLKRFRGLLCRQLGARDAAPHVRLLHLDTDPEARHEARTAASEETLPPNEVLLTKLNRPSHYLRTEEGRARLDAWMDVQMLYRIPRTPATAGVRALGRLAFFDNYKS